MVVAAERADKLIRFQVLPVTPGERTKIFDTILYRHPIVSTNSDIVPATGTEDTREILHPDTLGMRLFRGIYDSVYIVGPNETILKKQVARLAFGGWDYSVSFPLPSGGEGTMNWRYTETGVHMPFQTLHGPMPDKPTKPTDKAYVSTNDRPVNILHLKGTKAQDKFTILFLRSGIQVGTDVVQCVMVGETGSALATNLRESRSPVQV